MTPVREEQVRNFKINLRLSRLYKGMQAKVALQSKWKLCAVGFVLIFQLLIISAYHVTERLSKTLS